MSEKPPFGMWHPEQETLPVSPTSPSAPPMAPWLASSSSFPEKRVSKKNFLPSSAAAASSAQRLETSAGVAGSSAGDSVLRRARTSAGIPVSGGVGGGFSEEAPHPLATTLA